MSRFNRSDAGSITIPDLKLHYKATVTETAWYWYLSRHGKQRNRTEDRANPLRHSHPLDPYLILDKENKSMCWRKEPF